MGANRKYEAKAAAQSYEVSYQTKYKRADQLEKKLLEKLFSQFLDAKKVLEVGCGTGHFIRWLQSEVGLECVGVDVSEAMLWESKRLWPEGAVLRGVGGRLPFADKSVDVALFMTSLEFMPDAALAVEEAARVAAKGLVFGFLNKDSTVNRGKRIQAANDPQSFYYGAKFFSFSDLETLLNKVLKGQFTILSWETTLFPKGKADSKSEVSSGAFVGVAVQLRNSDE